jgi:hypothetical protein
MTTRLPGGATAHARFEVKWQDAWVGAFWKSTPVLTDDGPKTIATDVWICLVPCVPLHLTFWWPVVIPFGPPAAGEVAS